MKAIVRGIPSSYARATTRTPLGAIDVDRARAQHAAYVDALRSLGVGIVAVPVADELPDSCFVEDQAVVCEDLALACRVGHLVRRREAGPVREALAEHVAVVEMTDGNLDGGDVLRVGRTLFVGRSERTDADGIAALARTFEPLGYRVVTVDLGDQLHLKCAVSGLGGDRVLLAEGTLDPRAFVGCDVVTVRASDPYAANVVAIGDAAICSAAYPELPDVLARRGIRAVPLDLTELRKGDGACTCLSILV